MYCLIAFCKWVFPGFQMMGLVYAKLLARVRLNRAGVAIDQFGMTFLDQLGFMDLIDLLELSKGLSKIGTKIFECLWYKLRTSKSPFSFLYNTYLVPKKLVPKQKKGQAYAPGG